MKPRIFIGSSVETLPLAEAIQLNLIHDAEVIPWHQGIFNISETALESLCNSLNAFDFAVFIFKPEDITKIRGEEHLTVRDNIIFEMGLFIGALGRERVYFLIPKDIKFHLPTDLLGITPGVFDAQASNLQAALV